MEAEDFGVDDGAEGDDARRLVFLAQELGNLAGDAPRLLEAGGGLLAAERACRRACFT
jgi:hypothetical protein